MVFGCLFGCVAETGMVLALSLFSVDGIAIASVESAFSGFYDIKKTLKLRL